MFTMFTLVALIALPLDEGGLGGGAVRDSHRPSKDITPSQPPPSRGRGRMEQTEVE
jgi:hypothetical protein